MSKKEFDFDSGTLCLDFANTVDWHASPDPQDRLTGYSDLLAWGQAGGELSAARVNALEQLSRQGPEGTQAAFKKAVRLREAIYRIFSSLAADNRASTKDLAILNEVLGESLAHLRIIPSSNGFAWEWDDESTAMDQILWPVARSAAELLTSETLDRVRQCADDRGCGYLFVDMSRNRSRRWCSMESCGNRAKARRHYRRISSNAGSN
jgi:predicted RNA-binding Zn ribbon-like protein